MEAWAGLFSLNNTMIDTLLSDYRFIKGVNKALGVTRYTGYETTFAIHYEEENIIFPNVIHIGDKTSCGWSNLLIPTGMQRLANQYYQNTGIQPKMFDEDFLKYAQSEERNGRGIAVPFPYPSKETAYKKPILLDFHTHPINTELVPSEIDIRHHQNKEGAMMIGLPTHTKISEFFYFKVKTQAQQSPKEIADNIREHFNNIPCITSGVAYKGKIYSDHLEIVELNDISFK